VFIAVMYLFGFLIGVTYAGIHAVLLHIWLAILC